MKVIYNKINGNIISAISDDQTPLRYYKDRPKEFKDSMAYISIENVPHPLRDYYIKNEQIIEYSEIEKIEKKMYGKVLTDDERTVENIKPTQEEVNKALKQLEFIEFMEVLNNE